MKVTLNIDINEDPYLELLADVGSYEDDFENKVLKRFISEARDRGLKLYSESNVDNYASIRLKMEGENNVRNKRID